MQQFIVHSLMKYEADVFIPTANNIKALQKCLETLSQQSNKKFLVHVVSKSKDSRIESLVKGYKSLSIKYTVQKRKGLVGATNDALSKSFSKIFIRIDDDVEVSKNWIQSILDTFHSGEKIGGVTGPTIVNNKSLYA